jgi:cell division septation protein DedD
MRDNTRVRQQRFELSLGVKQVCGVVVVALVALSGSFALGASVGRRSDAPPAAQLAPVTRDALARLDEPVHGKEEPPPELKAHQVLTDSRSIEKTIPIAAAKPVKAEPAATRAEDKLTPEIVMPPSIPSAAPPAVPAQAMADPAVAVAAVPPRVDRVERAPRADAAAIPARTKGRYTVQVGAVPRRADAERLAQRLAARKPRIVTADVPGKGRWYRVQVGSYETQDAAKRQLAALARDGYQGMVTAIR